MEHYRDVMKVPELQDCGPTVKFIRKVSQLIKAMNSRNTWDSLRHDEGNESRKVPQTRQ